MSQTITKRNSKNSKSSVNSRKSSSKENSLDKIIVKPISSITDQKALVKKISFAGKEKRSKDNSKTSLEQEKNAEKTDGIIEVIKIKDLGEESEIVFGIENEIGSEESIETEKGSKESIEQKQEAKQKQSDTKSETPIKESVEEKTSEENIQNTVEQIEKEKQSVKREGKPAYDEIIHENYIKRERYKKQIAKAIVDDMRQSLPNYSLEEIRQFRFPFHEALLINLAERGYISTAHYIKELIKYQDDMREQALPGSNILFRPQLKFCKDELIFISDRLKICETFHNEENYHDECDEFLKIALHFSYVHQDWWWLGEQLLIQSIKVSTSYESLYGKYEALSRYSYARFLLENVKEYENAAAQLKITSQLSQGKGWTAVSFFPEVRGTLYMQTNHAIFDCMLRDAKELMKTDMKGAIAVANQARHRAAAACHHNGETKAFIVKGLCEIGMGEAKTAVNSFQRAFVIQEKLGTPEGLCKIRIHLAKAYLLDNCANASLRVLMDLKRDAEENNLPFYLGQAYKSLGDYYLSIAQPEKANPLLKEALRIFKECNVDADEIANVRNLEAISAGLQLFAKFIEVLNNAGTENNWRYDHLMKLVDWKDQRTEFWTSQDNLRKYSTLSQIITKSLLHVQASRPELIDEKFKALSQKFVLNKKARSEIPEQEEYKEEGITEKSVRKVKLGVEEEKDDEKGVVQLYATQSIITEESRLIIDIPVEEEDDDIDKDN